MVVVKNREESETLSHLPTSTLACHCFLVFGRKLLGQRQWTYYSQHSKWYECRVHVLAPQVSQNRTEDPRWMSCARKNCLPDGAPERRNSGFLVIDRKHTPAHCSGSRHDLCVPGSLDKRCWKDHLEQKPAAAPLLLRCAKRKGALEIFFPKAVQWSIWIFASQSPESSAELPRAGRGKRYKSKSHPLVPCFSSKKSLDVFFCFSPLPQCWASG